MNIKTFYKNKTILITGGTGSFGSSYLDYIIKNNIKLKKLIIFSRDEYKQHNLQQKYPESEYSFLRFFLGDIRDRDRMISVMNGVDYVINAAALKHVYKAEYDPDEFIKTNINGVQNLINACIKNKVKKVITLSTDKACEPFNLYGATKLCAEKLLISANNIKGNVPIKFTVLRYGNVFNSRGSIVPKLLANKNEKIVKITDRKMTRFSMMMSEAIEMVNWSMINCIGREVVIPKLKSYKLVDLVKAIAPKSKIIMVGKKIGEKIHEKLISNQENENVYFNGKYYLILYEKKDIKKIKNFKKISLNEYSSNQNTFMTVKEIKNKINIISQ
jgi:UDP-N-acetylglucosamine 4,6-dehydratase/5-epimerase